MERRVQEVLDFWFGGDQQVNYRTKWFPEGSSALQAAIDTEIFQRFNDLLEAAIEGELKAWESANNSTVALIIVLDQFSRHIYRYRLLPAGCDERVNTDKLALTIANKFHEIPNLVLQLPTAEYIFSMMPLRHSPSIGNLEFILARLTEKENSNTKALELLERFRKQTTRRLQHLQDRAKLEVDDEILERHPFQADETNILEHPLVKATELFLKKHLSTPPYHSKSSKTVKTKKNILLLSLSGGVDSMVISKILAVLKASKRIPIDEIVGMHIDYANRPESSREAAYVHTWCDMIGLIYRCRMVNEVTRGVTSRDDYEKISRHIRYAFYQVTIEEALQGAFTSSSSSSSSSSEEEETSIINVSGVMFGHHIGDVQENVISNIMRGSSPLDLSGMTETSVTNHVHVWRPLLSHDKTQIYAFAHQYGVPYFKDTTPSWSTRGKLRNQLIPLLLEVYGNGCLRNLSNLAHESDSMQDLVFQNLYAPFLNGAKRYICGIQVNIREFIHQPLCFWKEMLKTIMHSMGMSMIREKSVHNFVERLGKPIQKGNPKTYGWLELRKGFHTYLSDEYDLIIVKDNVLRKNMILYNPATTRNQLIQQSTKKLQHSHQGAAVAVVVVSPPTTTTTEVIVSAVGVAEESQVQTADTSLPETMFQVHCHLTITTEEHAVVTGMEIVYPIDAYQAKIEEEFELLEDDETHSPLALTKEQEEVGLYSSVIPIDDVFQSTATSTTTTTTQRLVFGPWEILLSIDTPILSATEAKGILATEKKKAGRHITDILGGRLEYDILWPVQGLSTTTSATISLVFLKDVIHYWETQQGKDRMMMASINNLFQEDTSPIARSLQAVLLDMKGMELRLRDGLPLFIPHITSSASSSATPFAIDGEEYNSPSSSFVVMHVVYQYVGMKKIVD